MNYSDQKDRPKMHHPDIELLTPPSAPTIPRTVLMYHHCHCQLTTPTDPVPQLTTTDLSHQHSSQPNLYRYPQMSKHKQQTTWDTTRIQHTITPIPHSPSDTYFVSQTQIDCPHQGGAEEVNGATLVQNKIIWVRATEERGVALTEWSLPKLWEYFSSHSCHWVRCVVIGA